MNTRTLRILFGLALLLLSVTIAAAPALAAEVQVSRLEILSRGVYEYDPSVPGDHRLVKETTTIPAQEGLTFGVMVRFAGYPAQQWLFAQARVSRPQAGGTTEAAADETAEMEVAEKPFFTVIGDPFFLGWTFTEENELRTGPWAIAVLYEGRVLGEAQFTVVRRGEADLRVALRPQDLEPTEQDLREQDLREQELREQQKAPVPAPAPTVDSASEQASEQAPAQPDPRPTPAADQKTDSPLLPLPLYDDTYLVAVASFSEAVRAQRAMTTLEKPAADVLGYTPHACRIALTSSRTGTTYYSLVVASAPTRAEAIRKAEAWQKATGQQPLVVNPDAEGLAERLTCIQ